VSGCPGSLTVVMMLYCKTTQGLEAGPAPVSMCVGSGGWLCGVAGCWLLAHLHKWPSASVYPACTGLFWFCRAGFHSPV